MKRNIRYILVTLAAVLMTACQNDPENLLTGQSKQLHLKVEIDQMGTGLQPNARSVIVGHQPDENKVNDIHLLFFKKPADGSAPVYWGYYKVEAPIELDTNFEISYSNANEGNYSVLAFANIEGYYINSPALQASSLNDYLAGLTSTDTEEDVVRNTSLYIGKVATGSTDKVIEQHNLFMSGRTEKVEDEQLITLKLTRAVSRFDVQILDDDYELASVSVWNNAAQTPVWLSSSNASGNATVNPGHFYGIQYPAGTKDIKGGLYSFENYHSDPAIGDKQTTCLVLGIRKPAAAAEYYRVNIHPEESGQSLKRNYVYQVTVRTVLGTGTSSEQDAYESKVDPNLDIDINNWSLDDEGIILTDGKNTLAIPSKIIRFAQEGGTRTYTIFTQGEGVLTMSPNIPSGFTVTLTGNQLKVTAEPLGTLKKREGTLDIGFAGLKGTVQILQEPKESHFLRVDKSIINKLPPTSGGPYKNNAVRVTSSENWIAKIYNTGGSRFSFVQGDGTALETSGSSGDDLSLFVSQDNATNKVLTGFVLISLENEPGYNRVVMLKQSASTGISIDFGSLTDLRFYANGAPKSIPDSQPGDPYEFLVDPGHDDDNNYYDWGAQLTGTNAGKFKLITEKNGSTHRVIVVPKGNTASGTPDPQYPYYNLTPNEITGVELAVYWGNDYSAVENNSQLCKKIPISQDALVFTVNGTHISKAGGVKDIQVNAPDGLSWKVKILQNWTTSAKYALMEHKGYLVNGQNKLTDVNDEITGLTGSTLKVGFDKLLFPIVNVQPEMKLEVSLEKVTGYTQTINVTQEMLVPRPVNILNTTGGNHSYGALNNGSYVDPMIEMYKNLFSSTTNAAAIYADFIRIPEKNSSTLDNFAANVTSPKKIAESGYNYIHAAWTKTNWTQQGFNELERWRQLNDGVMLIVQDYDLVRYNASGYWNMLKAATGYQESSHSSVSRVYLENNTSNNRILKYLYVDGPFGNVVLADLGYFSSINNIHAGVLRSTVETTGTPVAYENGHTESILVFIDPDKKIVFIGEVELFDNGTRYKSSNVTDTGTSSGAKENRAKSRFYANLLSYIIRAAQYGSHFTDHFKKGSTTDYPFDKLTGSNREPAF